MTLKQLNVFKRKNPRFNQVYGKYLDRVYAYVGYRVGNIQDTEDIVSEVFLSISRSNMIKIEKHDRSEDAWVFTIARNKVIDFIRKTNRRPNVYTLEEIPNLSSLNTEPEEQIIKTELFRLLHKLIKRLPTRQQEIITLRFFGQLKNREIAELLDIKERTVSAYLSRTVRQLEADYIEATQIGDSSEEVNDERTN